MRSQGIFLVFILSLTLGLQYSYRLFREHYSETHELRHQLTQLDRHSQTQALTQALLQNQIDDLQASVYTVLAAKQNLNWKESQWKKSLRAPASVPFEIAKSGLLMDQARAAFREKNFVQVTQKLKKMIQEYPASPDIIEAHFLLGEALFVSEKFEPALDLIENMMTQFPDSELTGYIMLRMGQIYESKKLIPEARETYQTVQREFARSESVRTQATQLLKRLE